MANSNRSVCFVFVTHFPQDVKVESVVQCVRELLSSTNCHSVIRVDPGARQALFFTEFSPEDFMFLSEGLQLMEDGKINDDECESGTHYFIHTGDIRRGKLYLVSKQYEEKMKNVVENIVIKRVKRSLEYQNIAHGFIRFNDNNADNNKKEIEISENCKENNTFKGDKKTEIIDSLQVSESNHEIDADKVNSTKEQHLKISNIGRDDKSKIRSSLKNSTVTVVAQTLNEITSPDQNIEKNLKIYFKVKTKVKRSRKVLPRSSPTVLNYTKSVSYTPNEVKPTKGNQKRKMYLRNKKAHERTENICGVKVNKDFEDNSDDRRNYFASRKTISLHPKVKKGDGTAVFTYIKDLIRHLRDITKLPKKGIPPQHVVLQVYPSRKSKQNKSATRRPQQRTQRREGEPFPVQVSEEGNQAAGPPTFDSLLTSSESIFRRLPNANERPPQPQQPTAPTTNLTSSLADEQALTSRRQGLNQTSTRNPPRPPRHPEYADRNRRQMSFTNWPTTTHQDPTLMTNYGFFYTGRFDLVRCYQCGIGLKDWAEPDEPLFEHIKHASDCPFLLELLGPDLLAAYKVNLIPAGATPIENTARPGTQGAAPAAQTRSQGAEAGSTETPGIRSPEYADMEARIRSYNNNSWPSDISQTPQQLAEAGFFYTGHGDICRCFTCDGGLQRWDPQDDPWIEHTRWFSHCAYVRRMKGDEYVELVRRALAASSEDEDPAVIYPPPGAGSVTGAMANLSVATVDPLSTPSAQSVLNMGYGRQAVLLAIHELDARGYTDYTGGDIIEVLMDKEDRGEALPTDSPTSSMPTGGAQGGFIDSDPRVLQSENQRLKGILKCMRCDIRDCNMLFLPCTHHRLCEECSEDVEICPICERQIAEKIRTYMS